MELYHKKSKSKSKSKTRNMKKYKHKKEINSKKNKNKIKIIKMKGGMNTTYDEQNYFLLKTYLEISTYSISGKTVYDLQQFNNKYCKELYDIIYNQPGNWVFTNNYLAKLLINMFLPKILSIINLKNEIEVENFEKFQTYVDFIPEFGSILKKYGLTNLTKNPIKSLEVLLSCKDDVLYCPMDSSRFISDYENNVQYLCDKNDDSIYRINNKEDLKKIKTNDRYLYCVLPNETLCLFSGNHSAGACGQPVLCAGFVEILNNQIISIDNDSGHYRPNQEMLRVVISILTRKHILLMQKEQSIDDNIIKVIFT